MYQSRDLLAKPQKDSGSYIQIPLLPEHQFNDVMCEFVGLGVDRSLDFLVSVLVLNSSCRFLGLEILFLFTSLVRVCVYVCMCSSG